MKNKQNPICQSGHKYIKIINKKKETTIYKCLVCPHWVAESQVLGRLALCNYCGKDFLMNQGSLLLRPHCGCRLIKRKKLVKKVEDIVDLSKLDDLIGDLIK